MDFALAAPFGLVIGSFLNVVAYRVPRGESLVAPGSHCTSCGEDVKPWDNVPILSWLMLRGRCRGCGERISAHYPLIELLTGVVFAAIVLVNGLDADLALELPFAAMLVAVSLIDLEHRIIPNRIVLPAAGICLVAQTLLEPSPEWAIAALGASGFLLVAALVYPAGMGMGDVKLALLLGAGLGRVVPVAMMVAMIAALVPSAALFARHGQAARKMKIPFGPFLALGGVVGLFGGDRILDAYLGIL
jgi:leader peptidase (prepilin peptidase) / N-methyltransferase